MALPRSIPAIRIRRRYVSNDISQYQSTSEERQYVEAATDGGYSRANAESTTVKSDDPVKQDWDFFQHQKAMTGNIGSNISSHYKPHELLSNPPRPEDITLELLMASQAHIGHSTSLWHPANAKYIFGVRGIQDPIHIISLDVTAAYLRRACKVVQGVTESGGLVLFVGSRPGQARTVVKAAEMAQGCHLFNKWIPGTITNGQQILGSCRKKVVDEFDKEIEGFEDQLLATAAIKPDLVVCFNPQENYVLLHECGLNNIPTIGIIDTDTNPTWVTYPIPANDDSLRCVQVIAGVLGRAGEKGQKSRLALAERGIVTYMARHDLRLPSKEDEITKKRQAKEQSLLAAVESFDIYEQMDEESDVLAESSRADVEHANGMDGLRGIDESLITEQQTRPEDKTFEPYARDAPLEAERLHEPDQQPVDHFDHKSATLETPTSETFQGWGHKSDEEKKSRHQP
ncbi:hypothetical protein M433DRAFT_148991 [Acidomyces richmondensis BFW]|nr:MAG: hypothetical protein FE78DRAFT_85686 [Acidomyces sp. 'richmondensis']KYG50382.1 hypothetical protein M433DRAFT_148991 [Acidomyces richmondensis BFW]